MTRARKNTEVTQPTERGDLLSKIIRYFFAHHVHPRYLTIHKKTTWFVLIRSDPRSRDRMRQFLLRHGMSEQEHPCLNDYPKEAIPMDIPPEISVFKQKRGRTSHGRGEAKQVQETFSLAPLEGDFQRVVYEFCWYEGNYAHTS